MKKTATLMALLACAICAFAQNDGDILKKIQSSPARKAKVEGNFKEVRNFPDKSKPAATLSGKLSYDPAGKIMMKYENGEEFSIDGNMMVIDRDGKRQQFDTSKNIMMRGLSHAITYAFEGRMDELSKEQNARMLISEKNGKYIVALTAQAASARGYSCIEVAYNAKTGVLETIRMDEFTGARTFYSYVK